MNSIGRITLFLMLLYTIIGCGDEGITSPIRTEHRTLNSVGTIKRLQSFLRAEEKSFFLGFEDRTELVASIASESVVSISVIYIEDEILKHATGSGFFIGDQWIATAYHVVQNAVDIEVSTIFDSKMHSIIKGTLLTDESYDLAIFAVEHTLSLPRLYLGDSDNVAPGEWLCVMGNPNGYKGIFTAGVASGLYGGNDFIDDAVLHISIPTWKGSSGGPVLNLSGEVVGILSGGIGQREFMSYAIPINALRDFINRLAKEIDHEPH